MITEFCNEYRTLLEGNATDLSSQELSGGARISFVLHEIFAGAIRQFDPLENVKDVDIRTILYNSSVSVVIRLITLMSHQSLMSHHHRALHLRCLLGLRRLR